MPDISECRIVHCPDRAAPHDLARFVAEHHVGGGPMRIALGREISLVADRRIRTKRRVIATLYPFQWIGARSRIMPRPRAPRE